MALFVFCSRAVPSYSFHSQNTKFISLSRNLPACRKSQIINFYTLKGLRKTVIPFCAQKSVFDFARRMINACFCMPGYQGALAAQADFARLGKARLLRIYPQVLNQLLFALESQQHAAESSFSGGKNSSTGNSMPRKVSHGFCVLHSHSLSGMQ